LVKQGTMAYECFQGFYPRIIITPLYDYARGVVKRNILYHLVQVQKNLQSFELLVTPGIIITIPNVNQVYQIIESVAFSFSIFFRLFDEVKSYSKR